MKLSTVGRNRKYIAGMSIFWTALAYWFAISVAFEDVSRRPLLPFQLVVLAIGGSLQLWGILEAARNSNTQTNTSIDEGEHHEVVSQP
jgi:hypothetical protein